MSRRILLVLIALLLAAPASGQDFVYFKKKAVAGGGGAPPNIAFDAKSTGGYGTGNFSWTHTPVGTPKAVIVYVFQANNGTDYVTAATYGGVSMTEVTGSPNGKSTGEAMSVYAYFLGSSIPTGAQTVAVTVSGTAYKTARCITLTATGDTSITDTTNISSDSVANPSGTLSLGGVESYALFGFVTGHEEGANVTNPAGWTQQYTAIPFDTTEGFRLLTYDTLGTTDVTFGATQTAEDFIALGIAVKVVAAGASCATQSYDVQYTTYDTTATVEANDERGQSWLSGVSKVLYSISISRTNSPGTEVTTTWRVGTSSDLSSSYLVEFSCDLPGVNGFVECVIPEGSRPSLSASTTYHFLFQNTEGAVFVINRDADPAGYADGNAYYDVNENFVGTTSTSDLPFKIKVCD